MKEKYGDQDDEERQLRMEILAVCFLRLHFQSNVFIKIVNKIESQQVINYY